MSSSKRALEDTPTSASAYLLRKRPRLSGIDLDTRLAPPLSSASSFTASRACSPADDAGFGLMRSTSSSSLSVALLSYSECSAKYHLLAPRPTLDLDFALPPTPAPNTPEFNPAGLICSAYNTLFFTRGNRVCFKSGEEIVHLCRLSEGEGDLRVLAFPDASSSSYSSSSSSASPSPTDILAIGTSKGVVQLWDIRTRKRVLTLPSKNPTGVTALAWNGPVLTVGGEKGTIRHYDTRVRPKAEQVGKITRHQATVTCLKWNMDGKILASGDGAGMVYCWEWPAKSSSGRIPMDVGEFVQRRKKMQHPGPISALAFCPWQPRLLASGDTTGIVHFWTVNPLVAQSNLCSPGTIILSDSLDHSTPATTRAATPTPSALTRNRTRTMSLSLYSRANSLANLATANETPAPTPTTTEVNPDTKLSSIHFSPQCKEVLLTYGNTIAVHSYPSLKLVSKLDVGNGVGRPQRDDPNTNANTNINLNNLDLDVNTLSITNPNTPALIQNPNNVNNPSTNPTTTPTTTNVTPTTTPANTPATNTPPATTAPATPLNAATTTVPTTTITPTTTTIPPTTTTTPTPSPPPLLPYTISSAVLLASGTRCALMLPAENKVSVAEVWGKRKEVKRQSSFASLTGGHGKGTIR
ncbi:hypothetical protein H0H92_004008 [Tricholoma furcatifolium]|nr:hypothetical protein H0H92_004008 [Tricholoma furcatifolium]